MADEPTCVVCDSETVTGCHHFEWVALLTIKNAEEDELLTSEKLYWAVRRLMAERRWGIWKKNLNGFFDF